MGVGRDGADRDDHVAELVVRLEAAARADAQQLLDPELISSSKTIVAPGQPMPVPCTETRLPSKVPV